MSFPLLRKMFKQNAVLYWAFIGVIVPYFFLVILMYPMITEMLQGEDNIFGDLFNFGDIGSYTGAMVGELLYTFGLILFIMLVFKLAYKPIDVGSLSMTLMTGISRTKYMITACVFLLMKLAILFVLIFATGILSFLVMGEEFTFVNYLNVVALTMLCLAAVVFIALFLGIMFAGKKAAMALIIAVPVVLYILFMASQLHTSLNFLRWLSVFGWFVPAEVATGTASLWWIAVMVGYVVIVAVSFVLSTIFFKKKDLSL
ncbi:MAG: hypothetical protein FWE16_04050 [Firmicutes bacterium]|nr:hypothetical protein [Bacillota bacterium]